MNATEEAECESFTTCIICTETFDDEEKPPKQLPCYHIICLRCLQEIYRAGLVKCPLCRQNHRCHQGVERLPTSQLTLYIIRSDRKSRYPQSTIPSRNLVVESLVKGLMDNYSPNDDAFFGELRNITQLVVRDPTRSLDRVWKLQDKFKDNRTDVSTFLQTIAACARQMAQQHLDYLISDVQARWLSDNTQRLNLLDFLHKLYYEGRNEQLTAKVMDVVAGFVFCADTSDEFIDPCIDKMILNDELTSFLFHHWLITCAQTIQLQPGQRLALAAMKLLRHLCYLFAVTQAASNNHHHNTDEFKELVLVHYKNIYRYVDQNWQVFGHVIAGFVTYVQECRSPGNDNIHIAAVEERVAFLFVFLKYGEMCMDEFAASSVWVCLTDVAISNSNSALCFQWFADIVGNSLVHPKAIQRIFHQHILKLDPRQMTNQTAVFMYCFERFFRAVQCAEGDTFTEGVIDPRPGLEFLLKIVLYAQVTVAHRAFNLAKETIIYLGPRLLSHRVDVNNDALSGFLDRFKDEYLNNRERLLQCGGELNLMNGLVEFLERQAISRISDVMQVPQRFDNANTIFLLMIKKNGRNLGTIYINFSPRFPCAEFVQALGTFCYAIPRKFGQRIVNSKKDTCIRLEMKNAMFQPVVHDMISYRNWLDPANYAQRACQVGITSIKAGSGRNEGRVKGWQFVFFLHDIPPSACKSKKSLLFGNVIQGIDVVKSLSCSNLTTSHFSDGLRFILKSVN
ncbi:probable ubiquitin carboxyl-terminal hydrolase FAF-X [Daphnia carinata]|uniref:probable ubiquitin carboxyl-terminal hydrolase FAF-X n=1 Tax=Daphnia carinata TaxID=120202 RepID=UPI00257A7D70|nr:probable ubiquitin carboxyl-terminal hydrolase FAF-X [Daphnia carinata]